MAVRAPTGQIWTVLPLKYEVKTWSCEDVDLDGVAPSEEVDLGLAGDLVGEADAAAALDAALAVEQHQLGDGDGLGPVALLLEEPALARPVGEDLVLQRALAALVAHRAVERMVDEQELEHPVLGLLDLVRGRVDHLHARRPRRT